MLIGFVSLMLILGLFISDDYGYSTDEDSERTRAKIALSHYGIPNDNRINSYRQIHHKMYYGTAVSMVGVLADELLSPILGTPVNAVWHGVNYLLFLTSIVGIFYLVRLFTSDGIAFFASLLYASQPLYFGHAFINPKDMPLQAMFILTITLGFIAERHPAWQKRIEMPYTLKTHIEYWRSLVTSWGPSQRWVNAIALILLLTLILFKQWAVDFVGASIKYFYTNPVWLLRRMIWAVVSLIDSHPTADSYQKLVLYFERAYPLLIIALGLYLGLIFFTTFRRHPALRKNSPILFYSDNLVLLAAGAVFGIALSTRLIAFAAGGIVGLYYLWSYRQKAIPPLILYSIMAFFVHYATWPVFWEYNFSTILKNSLSLLAYFDPLSGVGVPFEGEIYRADALPNFYLAKLLTFQFTLPLLILAFIGLTLWLIAMISKRANPPTFRKELLILLWFLLPFAYVTIETPVMYNSFRQFLFITPPLVVFGSIGMERIKTLLPKAVMIGVMALCLVPGVLAIIELHPYQYIYYNELAGGTRAAYETYDLDYWYLATPEAMAFINETAELNAKVYVTWGADDHARLVQRPDLKIPREDQFVNVNVNNGYQYAVISTENFQHQDVPPTWRLLHIVQVQGAPLFYIYAIV